MIKRPSDSFQQSMRSCVVVIAAFIAFAFSPSAFGQSKPNIILINLDDADFELFDLSYSDQLFPNIMAVAEEGISFRNFHVTTPLCGPSRACLYRAQYAHNTGVCVNQSGIANSHNFDGGFKFYREQGFFEDDLSTWMQDAGYRTMMVGKFLHHDFEPVVPAGWDEFDHYLGGRYYDTYHFTNREVAGGAFEQLAPEVYRTVAETEVATRLLEKHAAKDSEQPFFLNLNPYGPHNAPKRFARMVETRKLGWWPNMLQPFSPAYNEIDFDDKRGHFRGLPMMPAWGHGYVQYLYRKRALATSSCDDMVGKIRETLADLGLDSNTYIFITSDNGYSLGHHRTLGKGTPTDRCTRVPCFVIGPGIPAGRTSNHLIAHIDLGPTFVAIAGGTTPDFVDGRAFDHLLTPTGIDDHPTFRQAMLVENWFTTFEFGHASFGASTSLRKVDSVYTEWANGERDFFDLKTDPLQLNNTYDELEPLLQESLFWSLRALKNPDHPPKARFSNPYLEEQTIAVGSSLRGLAEDALGVRRVSLAIRDSETGRFWNGTDWQNSFTLLTAELENPDGQITFWNYSKMPTGEDIVPGTVVAWAWACNENACQNPAMKASFNFDGTPPELTFIAPHASYTGPALLEGTASDDVGVEDVRIFIRKRMNGDYWNGEGFQESEAFIATQTDNHDQWGLMISLPVGKYLATAQARDQSGHVSEPSSIQMFEIK